MGSASIPSISQLWEGRTIDGKFALLDWLGGSSNQGVFVTLRLSAHRAAIKLILAEGADAEAWLSQWELARRLTHPNLMPIFETGRASIDGAEIVYVITECAERVLSQFIQDRPLKQHEASNIVYPIVDALSYLHAKGFIHGRVKPSNILVSSSELKLSTDSFVVAAAVPNSLVKPGPDAAPELSSGQFTPAADVWSLGTTLVEALTQHPLAWNPATGQPPEIPQSLPLPFAEIVPECLRLDPASRCTLADIKKRIIQPPPPAPLPSPQELAARVARQPAQPTPAPTQAAAPPPRAAAAAEPAAPAPPSRWKPEEPRFTTPSPNLFASMEGPPRRRRSFLPLALGVVLILALCTAVLALTGVVAVPPLLAKYLPPLSPAASHPAPPRSDSAAASSAPATAATKPPAQPEVQPKNQPEPQTESQPAQASQAAPSTPAVPIPSAPETEASPAAAQPASEAPAPPSTAHAESQAETREPRPRNAPGAVANRILPAVSPEAGASMRAPVLVVLRVTVNRNGSVADASYVSPGAGNYFARIAQRAALQWTFDPPLHAGRPQASVWLLRFHFSRGNIEVSETEEDR